MNGNNILIYWKGPYDSSYSVIAATRSHKVHTECGTIDICSSTNSDWTHHIPERKSWTINVDFLVLNETALQQLLKVGSNFMLKIEQRDHQSGGTSISGLATMTVCDQTFTRGNLCVGTFQFKGNGPLS